MILDEDQRLLQASAKDFVATRSSLKRVRALAADPAGFSRDLWGEMARLGWLGLSFPEEHGGAGLPWRYLMVVLEELGAGLVPEPMLSTVLLGGTAILLGGDDAQKRRHLPRIAAGEELIALAYQEAGSRYALDGIEARADGGTVSGEKIQVLGGSAADWLVVSARGPTGIGLYLVEAGATFVQMDEPSPAIHPDAPADFSALFNAAVEPIVGRARIGAHLCFGNYLGRPLARRTYRPVLDAMLGFRVDELVLEFANREMAEIEILGEIAAAGRDVGAGIVDVKNYYIETAEDVAGRIDAVLGAGVPVERLTLVPDCGFSQTARWATTAKLRALVAGRDLVLGRS